MFMAVLDLPCDGSVQMTASHHPGDRNGLKFFTVDGGLDSPDIAYILEKAEDIELGDAPANTSSTTRISGSRWAAIANPNRTVIPEE